MLYIEAPNGVPPSLPKKPALFLAGGITGCPDWQMKMCELLCNQDLVVMNPRRKNFDVSEADASRHQIEWEHTHLRMADAVLFWFPCETLCPIVLFELGAWAYWQRGSDAEFGNVEFHHGFTADELVANWRQQMGSVGHEKKPIFVGVHPDYARRTDVEIQLALQRPDVTVASSLEELAQQVVKWSEGNTQ